MRRHKIASSIQAVLLTCLPAAAVAQSAADAQGDVQQLDAVQVTGSRIPRAQVEGPAPVTVMTAEDIRANGFVSVPDVLRAMTQNGGETQSQQSLSGADFSPGAQQVDLRGLGPNHTLVLVNGRRIADFPMPFKGRSNFTDISNIPLGMVDRIEVLTGSASAVYGSDAISGVVNFILKRQFDGVQADYRYGNTDRGGAESHKLSLAGGFGHGALDAVFGLELLDQTPLWARDREIQDSTKDAPTATSQLARRAFLRTYLEPSEDYEEYYADPGEATCQSLAHLNDGTTYYAYRRSWGYFCGSDEAIGYGTVISKRRGANLYGSATYRIGEQAELFADLQAGYHELELFRDVRSWAYMAPDGNEEGYFYNEASGLVEYWQRQFSPEEMGGLRTGMVRNTQKTFGLTAGFKGVFAGDWNYELAASHSQYKSTISWPQIVSATANRLMLGPQTGTHTYVDDSGNAITVPSFDADPQRLYTPLTRAEYDSIFARTVYHPESRSDTLSLTLNQAELFTLPGGAAGFAAVAEFGRQSYDLKPDPLALEYYYYSWRDSAGKGSRNRWALAGEMRLPLLERLSLSIAARQDQYRFAGRDPGKLTYSAGLEWRPLDSLLLRGSYGTGFRAPDLHYVFSGEGNLESSVTDYYRCATEEAGEAIEDCSFESEGVIVTRAGNRDLDPETSTSWTAGFVWSPLAGLDFSVDYFDIDMDDVVEDMSLRTIMQNEADCRTGALDPDLPTCQDALARVTRLSSGKIYGVYTNPVNVSNERTSGVDASASFRLPTRLGDFRFAGSHTWVREHLRQQFPGDPVEDVLAYDSGFYMPKTKSSASLGYERNAFGITVHGQRLSRIPNYAEDGWTEATYRYNLSTRFDVNDRMRLALSVTNLFDKMPPRDPTYTGYPYYDISWFDSLGRSYYLQVTYKFGGDTL